MGPGPAVHPAGLGQGGAPAAPDGPAPPALGRHCPGQGVALQSVHWSKPDGVTVTGRIPIWGPAGAEGGACWFPGGRSRQDS